MKIIPAILATDIKKLEHDLLQVEGLDTWIQVDIMDGKFVNNTSVSLDDFFSLELVKNFSMEIEVHLMVKNPVTYFSQCQDNNVKRVIFHCEAGDTATILQEAKKYNFQISVALNPETHIKEIMPYIGSIDVAVLMSVNPGLQGQAFLPQTLEKIKELRQLAPDLKIEVDGGISNQ